MLDIKHLCNETLLGQCLGPLLQDTAFMINFVFPSQSKLTQLQFNLTLTWIDFSLALAWSQL